MHLRQSLDQFIPCRGQVQSDYPVVVGILDASDKAGLLGPVNESHDTVMTNREIPGDLPDRRSVGTAVAFHGEQELVLARRQPLAAGLFLAPM
jgi:hypothetical protein